MRACLIVLLFLSIYCKKTAQPCINSLSEEDLTERLIFQSGYEPDCYGVPADALLDIYGADLSHDSLNDWTINLEGDPNIGSFQFYYEDGETSDRYARIIPEPGNENNHLLIFWLKNAAISNGIAHKKGRIQAAFSNNTRLKEFYIKQRIYLHPDMATLQNYPQKINWLTLQEFWNNATHTGEDYIFRITLNLRKTDTESSPLYLGAHGQTRRKTKKWDNVWEVIANDFPIPFGSWFYLETYVKEGNMDEGVFKVILTTEDGVSHTLIDVHDFTHHPEDPCPDGFSDFNPMKLYTSDDIIEYVGEQGGVLQIYWDDFEFWKNHQP